MHKQGEYVRTSIRLYDPQAYEKFAAVCKENFTNATRELNSYIMKCAETGQIEGSRNAG